MARLFSRLLVGKNVEQKGRMYIFGISLTGVAVRYAGLSDSKAVITSHKLYKSHLHLFCCCVKHAVHV